jgi:hypothetical protein
LRVPVVRRFLAAPLALGFAAVFLVAVFLAEVFFAPVLAVERFALPVAAAETAPSSTGHLPVITRSAASATASAISAPSFVALVITELAALLAVSAASIPASLIALRAFGLALIAAAAAASPAASISLLIAAFAILSTVEFFDFEDLVDFEDWGFEAFELLFRVVLLAMETSIPGRSIDT